MHTNHLKDEEGIILFAIAVCFSTNILLVVQHNMQISGDVSVYIGGKHVTQLCKWIISILLVVKDYLIVSASVLHGNI